MPPVSSVVCRDKAIDQDNLILDIFMASHKTTKDITQFWYHKKHLSGKTLQFMKAIDRLATLDPHNGRVRSLLLNHSISEMVKRGGESELLVLVNNLNRLPDGLLDPRYELLVI